MSKGVALLCGGVGIAGASAVGNYILQPSSENKPNIILPHTLSDFKDERNYHCLNEYFPNLQLHTGEVVIDNKVFTPKKIDSKSTIESDFFSNTTRRQKPKSCLMISWDRDTYNGGKWKGNFRGLGTFVYGNRGFVSFTTAETSATKTQLNLFGGFYFLKKEKKSGFVYKYKELKSTSTYEKKIDKNDFDVKFPLVGTAISKDKFGDGKDNWGFIKNKNDLGNICTSEMDCLENKVNSRDWFTGRWEGEISTEGSSKIEDWSRNALHDQRTNVYSDISKLKIVLQNGFKDAPGAWNNKVLDGNKLNS